MMKRNEAVQKLATVGHLSMAHAEDLYDSIIPKPVVPKYVADWYEENKKGLELNLMNYLQNLGIQPKDEFRNWIEWGGEPILKTLINMHQFGYEVEKEPRYMVRIKGVSEINCYLNKERDEEFLFADSGESEDYRTKFTRKELEEADFGWVFNCEGVEVKEVTDE